MQKIETLRLILRNFTERDAQGLLEYSAHPRVNCFLDDRMSTLEAAAVNVQKRSRDDSYIAVCLKDSNDLVGELFYLKEEPDTYSVCWNFNARFEGEGYASESAKAFFEYLFMHTLKMITAGHKNYVKD